jgi:hypothetical protein
VISVIIKHVICVTFQGSHQGVQRKLYSLFLVQVGHYASLSTPWILQNWSSGYCGSITVLTQSFCLVSELPVFSLKLHKERWTNFILCTWVCLLPLLNVVNIMPLEAGIPFYFGWLTITDTNIATGQNSEFDVTLDFLSKLICKPWIFICFKN